MVVKTKKNPMTQLSHRTLIDDEICAIYHSFEEIASFWYGTENFPSLETVEAHIINVVNTFPAIESLLEDLDSSWNSSNETVMRNINRINHCYDQFEKAIRYSNPVKDKDVVMLFAFEMLLYIVPIVIHLKMIHGFTPGVPDHWRLVRNEIAAVFKK
jgi:hypothetical protein